jgi:Uncharacterized protein conserved in bacteria
MRKISTMAIAFICLIVLTGCGGGKKLSCTVEEASTYNEIDTTGYEIKFEFSKDGKKLNKFTESAYAKYSSSASKEDLNEVYEDLKDSCKEFNDYAGVTCKGNKAGTKLSKTITVNLGKATPETLKEFYLDTFKDSSYDEVKKEVEGFGYSCK